MGRATLPEARRDMMPPQIGSPFPVPARQLFSERIRRNTRLLLGAPEISWGIAAAVTSTCCLDCILCFQPLTAAARDVAPGRPESGWLRRAVPPRRGRGCEVRERFHKLG